MRAFISYSHRDTAVLERLHVHLTTLRREQRIDAWYDRDILAGDDLDDEIARELEAADIFLLLVTPDFIASDYCVEIEMRRALERHEAKEARVVPIIAEPCDWRNVQPLRQLKALPRDGNPISEWANANNAYLDIAQELRRIVDTHGAGKANEIAASQPVVRQAVPRYRAQRHFDEIDRSEFREASFDAMREYFERATAEINGIEGLRGRFVSRDAASFGCTIVNRGLQHGTAHLTVHRRDAQHALGDIYYSFQEDAARNTANGGFNVASDEYELFLSPFMQMFHDGSEKLTADQAAEQLWNELIQQAGIDHA